MSNEYATFVHLIEDSKSRLNVAYVEFPSNDLIIFQYTKYVRIHTKALGHLIVAQRETFDNTIEVKSYQEMKIWLMISGGDYCIPNVGYKRGKYRG